MVNDRKMTESDNYKGKWKDDCWKARAVPVFLLYFKLDPDFLSFDDITAVVGTFFPKVLT